MTKAGRQSPTSTRQPQSKKKGKIEVCERDPVLSVNGKSIFCAFREPSDAKNLIYIYIYIYIYYIYMYVCVYIYTLGNTASSCLT